MSTKSERFELRLRPNIPSEAELLSELESLDGVYGGKTELLRECLRRGFTALNAAVEAQPETSTEEEILDHLASVFPSGEYSYRIGKLFVDARAELRREKEHASSAVNKQPTQDLPPVVDHAEETQGEKADPVVAESSDPDGAAKPRPNWARFRGLAGSSDAASGEN